MEEGDDVDGFVLLGREREREEGRESAIKYQEPSRLIACMLSRDGDGMRWDEMGLGG